MPFDPKKEKRSAPQLSLLLDTADPYRVLEEARTLFGGMFGKGEDTLLRAVFEDVVSLFWGKFPGFKACDTPYHNLKHTTDVFLAMARLVHGARAEGVVLNAMDANAGLVAALMHDTGYILKESESYDSGAKLASSHIGRSIALTTRIMTRKGCSPDSILQCEQAIRCTDLETSLATIPFESPTGELLGKMLASADLLAQTSDRTYLEKLPLLYREFKEAGNGNYDSELDLIQDAHQFNSRMNDRLTTQLDCANRFFRTHFRVRWNLDADLYQVAIDRAMTYLAHILKSDLEHYRIHLRRALPRTFHKAG